MHGLLTALSYLKLHGLFLMTHCTDFELHCFFSGPQTRVSQGITAYVKYQFQVSMVGINTNSIKARLWVPEVF